MMIIDSLCSLLGGKPLEGVNPDPWISSLMPAIPEAKLK